MSCSCDKKLLLDKNSSLLAVNTPTALIELHHGSLTPEHIYQQFIVPLAQLFGAWARRPPLPSEVSGYNQIDIEYVHFALQLLCPDSNSDVYSPECVK